MDEHVLTSFTCSMNNSIHIMGIACPVGTIRLLATPYAWLGVLRAQSEINKYQARPLLYTNYKASIFNKVQFPCLIFSRPHSSLQDNGVQVRCISLGEAPPSIPHLLQNPHYFAILAETASTPAPRLPSWKTTPRTPTRRLAAVHGHFV